MPPRQPFLVYGKNLTFLRVSLLLFAGCRKKEIGQEEDGSNLATEKTEWNGTGTTKSSK